jgi:peptidoglycan/xylan/chitin deacetylase (PgdA/CDA1 family)
MGYLRRKLHNLTHPLLGRILMLHRVVEHRSEGNNRELEITPDFLKQTIETYRQQGHRFVSIDEACNIINHSRTDRPFVCLTFDDGYQDNYDIAYPILKQTNVPFAIYVTTGFIDNRLPMRWYTNEKLGINGEALKALDADPLCTIGAHTVSHPRLDTLSPEEQQKEIEQSLQELESLLGHPIRHFSYPHGAYNSDTLSIINKQTFRSVLHAWGGNIRRGANPLMLPRIELRQS